MFVSLPTDQAIAIRQKLLECLANESDRAVRNKISDAVADVARQYTDNSQSPSPNTESLGDHNPKRQTKILL